MVGAALRRQRRSADGAPFHGWRYAAIGATMNFMAAGMYGRGFSVYFLPLARDLGMSHASTSLIFGLASLEGGLQAPVAGYFIDRFGPRIMTLIGAILAGVGFLILPLAHDFLTFALIYVGVIALGINAGFHNAAGAIVNSWFIRRRGLAFGIISVGIALGGGVMTPIIGVIVLEWGWRVAVMISGVAFLAVGAPLALLIRNAPEDVGQRPDGIAPASAAAPIVGEASDHDYTLRQAVRTASYWLLALGITLRIAAQAGILVHIVPMMVWKGLDESVGVIVIATLSFSAVGTRLLMGWLGDRVAKRSLVTFGMFVGVAGAALLLFAPGNLPVVIAFGLMFSVTDGAAGLTWAMIGDFFGRAAYARLRGTITFWVSLGSVATPVAVGFLFDITEGYFWALVMLIGVYLCAALVFLLLRVPKPIALGDENVAPTPASE